MTIHASAIVTICRSSWHAGLLSLALLTGLPAIRGQNLSTLTVLHDFDRGPDGGYPVAAVVRGSDGNLYGTTNLGGAADFGTVFKITPAGTLTTLHAFSKPDSFKNSDGGYPVAPLIQGSDGNFYGTASSGGPNASGTVFKITPAGTLTTLYSFSAFDSNFVNADGAEPAAGLIQGSDGNFYGTTQYGGTTGAGTVFKLTPTGTLTNLHSFGTGQNDDGSTPLAGLIQGTDGNFYGTTQFGGTSRAGTVFKITPAGTLTTLYSFDFSANGGLPRASLVRGSDGNFYGTTLRGGGSNDGTIFKITPAGNLTTLHVFNGSDGANPIAGLIQGSDGNFYGTTSDLYTGTSGTVFRIAPGGTLTTLYTFSATANQANSDGSFPEASLIQTSDGTFYGTTNEGGTGAAGVVYKLTLNSPVITSATMATATVGHAFSYQITGTFNPTSYSVTGLPAGLSVNTQTGVISGTPQTAGTYTLALQAVNNVGSGTATLTLVVAKAGTPIITSATKLSVVQGRAFSYQITATDNPTSFGVQGLPAGLTVDPNTGIVSGKYQGSGTFTLTLNAYNAAGKGSAYLTLTVDGLPVITSDTHAQGKTNTAFSYQITATNHPTTFGVQGLPPGLTVNTTTGVISGTTKGTGTITLTLNAYNAAGKGSATLTVTFLPQS